MRNGRYEPSQQPGILLTAANTPKYLPPQASLLHSPHWVLSISLWINFYLGKSEEVVTLIAHKWITTDFIANPPLPAQGQ